MSYKKLTKGKLLEVLKARDDELSLMHRALASSREAQAHLRVKLQEQLEITKFFKVLLVLLGILGIISSCTVRT